MTFETILTEALKLSTAFLIPLALFLFKQDIDRRKQSCAVARAIIGDMRAIETYVSSRIERVENIIASGETVEIRELGFLRLISGVNTENILRECAVLPSDISGKVAIFYQNLAQYDLVLTNVLTNWQTRSANRLAYQLDNLISLHGHLYRAENALAEKYEPDGSKVKPRAYEGVPST